MVQSATRSKQVVRVEDSENLRLWVRALRSGEYAQCGETLTEVTQFAGKESRAHCCMGVGCEVAKVEQTVVTVGPLVNRVLYGAAQASTIPPKEFLLWLRFTEEEVQVALENDKDSDGDGAHIFLAEDDAGTRGKSLAELNDTEDLSFTQIADSIEAYGVTL